jgi:hypothetical protein
MREIIIRYTDMPCGLRGFVREDSEGDYNIYINARLSYDVQHDTVEHELRHIMNHDLDNELEICEIENIRGLMA